MAEADPNLQIQAPPIPAPSSTNASPTDDANMNEPARQISLSNEQLDNAGLDGLKVGDTFDVTLRCTVTDMTDGVTADIEEASDGDTDPDEGDPDAMDTPPKKPQSRVLSPKEAGFEDDEQ